MLSPFFPPREQLTLDDGTRLVGVHRVNDNCALHGCSVHSPSDHPLAHAPKHWQGRSRINEALGTMRRECKCGNLHPDYDSVAYVERALGAADADAEAKHVCCGCCGIERATVTIVKTA